MIADVIVDLQELYMSSMLVSSICSIDSRWVGADGCWFRKCSNCHVLISCLLKAFQWHSRCPKETCAIMIQEWHVGYACRTGWKITDSPNFLADKALVEVIMNRVLYWRYVVTIYSDGGYQLSLSVMVGKFAGWLIYFPALPNWVSVFQNSMGGSKIMSFMLQECIFPVPWFSICKKCLLHSRQTILYLGLNFKSHLPGCLFLKYMQSPILKDGGFLSMVSWAVLNLFSSKVFFAMANANLCVSRFSIPESGSPRKHCMGSNSWCSGRFGSLPYTEKNGVSAVAKFGVVL